MSSVAIEVSSVSAEIISCASFELDIIPSVISALVSGTAVGAFLYILPCYAMSVNNCNATVKLLLELSD